MKTFLSLALLTSVAVANTPEVVVTIQETPASVTPVVGATTVTVTATEENSIAQDIKEDVSEVGHQLKDAVVVAAHATQNAAVAAKDMAVDAAVATKDAVVDAAVATKEVASNVIHSEPVEEIKAAAQDIGYSIKRGAVAVKDATVEGAKTAYNAVIVKPARAIANSDLVQGTKEVVQDVANSDLAQGSKETVVDVGAQLKEAGEDLYIVVVQKPATAVKDAAVAVVNSDVVAQAQEIANKTYKTVIVVPATYAKETVITIVNSEGGQDAKELTLQISDIPGQAVEDIKDASKAAWNKISAIASSIF